MNLLKQKLSEVVRSLLPIIALVLLLVFTLVKAETDVIIRFLLGSVLVMLGLGIFLWGVDLAMNPIGYYMAEEVATSRSGIGVAILSFLLGFLVTVAEPDLLILGHQVEAASGGTLGAMVIVYAVSVGVGVLIAFGTFRLLRSRSYPLFMGIAYLINFALAILVAEEFMAVAFDASGATTGALTTPFVLALSAGLARTKGGSTAEEDSFGMVGVMSAGPIMAVMLLSILTGQQNIRGEAVPFAAADGILGPLLSGLPKTALESFIALLPLSALFFALNFFKFKAPRAEIVRIIKGLFYTLAGLALFLAGAHGGFMDLGMIIGMDIASQHQALLPLTGLLMGMIVVLMEPAVIVLGQQIEDATGGRIPIKIIKITLSIGVGLAIAGSMLRIMIPWMKLWYFLVPGFLIAIILSFYSDAVFVGIAYDAGGVASGPMTATFVLAFASGAAAMTPTANVLVDGFGVIAMVAMAPVLCIMIVGALFRRKQAKLSRHEAEAAAQPVLPEGVVEFYDLVVAVVNRGLSERAVALARSHGAGGATILRGRGSGGHDMRLFNVEIQKEKEVILWLTDARISGDFASLLYTELELGGEGGGTVFMIPASAMGLYAPTAAEVFAQTEQAVALHEKAETAE